MLAELLNAPLKHSSLLFETAHISFVHTSSPSATFFLSLLTIFTFFSVLSHSRLPACGHWPFHPSPDGMATERLMKHTGPRLSFFRCLFIWPLVTRPHTFRPYCDWLCSHTPKQWVNASYPALSRATLQRLHDSNHRGFSLGSISEAVLVVILTPKKTCQNQPYVLPLLVLLSTILQGKKMLHLSHLVRLSFPDTHWKSTEIGRFSGLLVIKGDS